MKTPANQEAKHSRGNGLQTAAGIQLLIANIQIKIVRHTCIHIGDLSLDMRIVR